MPEFNAFEHGREFEHIFQTASGLMVLATIAYISGAVLTLENVLIEPLETRQLRVGVPALLALRRFVLDAAREQGYTTVVVEGWRISGRNPQRQVHLRGQL